MIVYAQTNIHVNVIEMYQVTIEKIPYKLNMLELYKIK